MSFVPNPCGSSGSAGFDVNDNILCDIVAGEIVGTALAVFTYDEVTGAPKGAPVFINPNTGAPYVVQGTLQACNTLITTVDGTVALDAPTLAALESITVQNAAGASAVNIQDGGNSITVDGTITSTTGHAEDAPHASGDVGDFILGVRNDNAVTSLTTTDGDYSPVAVDIKGRPIMTTSGASLANGAETAVSSVAIQVAAANTARKGLIIQNTGTGDVRIGITGVTATTGMKLIPGDSLILTGGATPTNAVFAIRNASVDSIVLAQELA